MHTVLSITPNKVSYNLIPCFTCQRSSYPSPILSFNGYYSLALVSQLRSLVCLLMKIRLKLNRIKVHFNPPIILNGMHFVLFFFLFWTFCYLIAQFVRFYSILLSILVDLVVQVVYIDVYWINCVLHTHTYINYY